MAKEKKKETKPKSAAEVLAALEKDGITSGLNDRQFYTSGNLAIDWALGGGIAAGIVMGVNGKSGSGKTTFVMQAMKERQAEGGKVVWVDYERAFDKKYAEQLGLDHEADSFVYLKPRSLEQGCDAIADLVSTGEFSMVALDSVARMTTESELDGRMSDLTVADKAKAMYKFMRKILNPLDDSRCTLIVLNHLLEAINTSMPGVTTKISPGGNAVPYFASQIIETSLMGSNPSSSSDTKYDSHDIQFLVTKNRLAPPSRKVTVRNEFGTGFNATRSVTEVAKQIGLVTVEHAWTYLNDPKLIEILGTEKYNGYGNFVAAVDDNPAAKERMTKTALSVLQTGEIPE